MPWTNPLLPDDDGHEAPAPDGVRVRSYVDALREAQALALETDPRVFLIGEGIDDPGGVFGSTLGLARRFGPDRVMDCPNAENAMTGVAVGAAVAGLRPIQIHMRTDFLLLAADQLLNHAAKWRFMTGGRSGVPLVVRAVIGRGWGSAAQHSQGLHGLFLQVPGLKIVLPASPYDAKGLLLAAVADPDPVLFVEHRWLYKTRGPVPEGPYTVPLGRALVRRPGRDVTVVALSHMVYEAMRAARELAALGIEAEIIDPRTVAPLDGAAILESVARTGRLVIADTACATGGTSAAVACLVAEHLPPEKLKAPVVRVAWPDCPAPASPVLEQAYYPGAADIVRAARRLVAGERA